METATMGRVLTEATVENLEDLYAADRGQLPSGQVRRLVITDALVDTGAITLALPRSMLEQLGLKKVAEKRVRSATGTATIGVYQAVRLTVQGRDMSIDPIEVPDGNPVLVGQIPLEFFDFVIDLQGRRLIGNPAHGGEQILELY